MTDQEQIIYDILCSDEQPPEGQHWEGFVASKIAAALAQPELLAQFKFQEYGPPNWGESQVTKPEFVAEQKAMNEGLRKMVEQEPVAWTTDSLNTAIWGEGDWQITVTKDRWNDKQTPLYTAPPQREVYCGCGDEIVAGDDARCGTCVAVKYKEKEWVGLTDEEHTQIAIDCGCLSADWVFYGAAVERKLKEKNT